MTGVVGPSGGGTGISSFVIGDLLQADTVSTLALLHDVATGNALISGGISTSPSYGKIGLTTHISGVLPIANGGTNTSSALTSSVIMLSNGSAIVQGPQGTSTTVLHGNSSVPFYGPVVLTSDVSGILPIANGGTGTSSGVTSFVSSMAFQSSSNVAIVGGTINGTGIGATAASTGTFTNLSIGTAIDGSRGILVSTNALTGTNQRGYTSEITGTSSATVAIQGFVALPNISAAAFTCAQFNGFNFSAGTKGAGSSITEAAAFKISDYAANFATLMVGFRGLVNSQTGAWNLYCDGTASNYIEGSISIGNSTVPAQKLYIESSATAPAHKIKSASGTTNYSAIVWNTGASGNNLMMEFNTDATETERGTITYNRGGGVLAYNTTSDERSKKVIGLYKDSGKIIDAIPVHLVRMNGAESNIPAMIAHEAQAAVPHAVNGKRGAIDKDGKPIMQQLSYGTLVPILWSEVQQLRARIAILERR